MVEAVCACGQKQSAAEDQLSEISQCECGKGIRAVSAEQLPEGAGAADFDARLVVTKGPAGVGEQILLGGCMDIEIGKLPERHISLAGAKVSRLHAKLSRVDFGPSRWKIVDNKSTNGVFVNGERVEEEELQNGDLITVGDYQLRFENEAGDGLVLLDEQEAEPPMAVLRQAEKPARPMRKVVANADDAAVLAAMRKMQDKQTSWMMAIILLVVSLLAFLGSHLASTSDGDKQTRSVQFLAILVGILLVHEAGHFIAMRIFKYRNVRMFFIPFFGAAVSGRSYSAPGWKKVVVSLMGPVPGIILGGIIGLIGASSGNRLLEEIGLFAIIVNGLNLLPVLPLDGGRVMQTLLFSRHYLLDTGFRVVAAAALILLGIFGHGEQVLMAVAIAMLFGLPISIMQGKIAQELRQEGWAAGAGDDIPDDVALTIIRRLRAAPIVGKSKKVRTHATNALRVYELLAARPPEWVATGGFFALYACSLIAACVLLGLIVVEQRRQISQLVHTSDAQSSFVFSPPTVNSQTSSGAMAQPTAAPAAVGNSQSGYAVPQGPMVRVGPNGAPMTLGDAIPWPHQTMVANYDSAANADSAFAAAAPTVANGEVLEKFGETLFACFATGDSSAQSRWDSQLSSTKDKRIDSAKDIITISFTFTAPSEKEADQIQSEWRSFFAIPSELRLIPPWMPNDPRSSEEQSKDHLARQTYLKILQTRITRDAMLEQMSRAMFHAASLRDHGQVLIISQQIMDRQMQLRQAAVAQLLEIKDGSIDPDTVKAYQAVPAPKFSDAGALENGNDPAWQALAKHMGQLPATPGAERFSTQFGIVLRDGSTVRAEFTRFIDSASGGPALVIWLEQHHCTAIKDEVRIPHDRQPMRRGGGVFFPDF